MRNLFLFLWRYRFLTAFLILEAFSISLLTRTSSYHKSLSFSYINNFSGGILKTWSGINEYFYLKSENDLLMDENSKLKNQLESSFLITDTISVYIDTAYKYYPAKVISNSIAMQSNRIIVDKGEKHGIEKEMGVISENGIVGIVTAVSGNYAAIMSALSQKASFSGMIKQSGQLVSVNWPGKNYLYGEISDIPSHIQLYEGDTIITSGNSLIFPKGILIGTVVEHKRPKDKLLSKAKIKFSVDFNNLHHVYLLKNLQKPEIDSLLILSGDE